MVDEEKNLLETWDVRTEIMFTIRRPGIIASQVKLQASRAKLRH
jgi:hypothetical protein